MIFCKAAVGHRARIFADRGPAIPRAASASPATDPPPSSAPRRPAHSHRTSQSDTACPNATSQPAAPTHPRETPPPARDRGRDLLAAHVADAAQASGRMGQVSGTRQEPGALQAGERFEVALTWALQEPARRSGFEEIQRTMGELAVPKTSAAIRTATLKCFGDSPKIFCYAHRRQVRLGALQHQISSAECRTHGGAPDSRTASIGAPSMRCCNAAASAASCSRCSRIGGEQLRHRHAAPPRLQKGIR